MDLVYDRLYNAIVPCEGKGVIWLKLVFGMNQSLDGYVDHMACLRQSPTLFRHFVEEAQGQARAV